MRKAMTVGCPANMRWMSRISLQASPTFPCCSQFKAVFTCRAFRSSNTSEDFNMSLVCIGVFQREHKSYRRGPPPPPLWGVLPRLWPEYREQEKPRRKKKKD